MKIALLSTLSNLQYETTSTYFYHSIVLFQILNHATYKNLIFKFFLSKDLFLTQNHISQYFILRLKFNTKSRLNNLLFISTK